MAKRKRKYCPYCRTPVIREPEKGTFRDYCPQCKSFFYDNPLPVASAMVVENRRAVLVKRKYKPYKNRWCLPSGFAESGESIADAAIRELEEETGLQGKVLGLVDVESVANYFYGDLLFLTFEIERIGGELAAGDDASQVRYFAIDKLPKLAFSANRKAVQEYIKQKHETWAIIDSFTLALEETENHGRNLLSDRVVGLVEENAELIARNWLDDVSENRSTPGYHRFNRRLLVERVLTVTAHFSSWLTGSYGSNDIKSYYMDLGRERKSEGFALSEVVSALSLIKKHIWQFALSMGVWDKTMDIYIELELNRRINLFFDKAIFYTTKGYEDV